MKDYKIFVEKIIDGLVKSIKIKYENTYKNKINFLKNSIIKNEGYIYILKMNSEKPLYKIGVSRNAHKRLKQINPKMPYTLKLSFSVKVNNMYNVEKILHNIFAEKRMEGEWFELNDNELNSIIYLLGGKNE